MTLRRKTIMTAGLVFFSLIIILFFASQTLLLRSYSRLEEQDTFHKVEQASNALANEINVMETLTSDWAAWDDTYAFIRDANQDYIKSNLVDSTFTMLKVNLMLFIDSSGKMVYGKAFDLGNKKAMSIPRSLLSYLPSGSLLVSHPDPQSIVKGIILLPEDPMLIVSYPILTSSGEGPVRGTLIVGRYLDSGEINGLAEQTQLSLTLARYDSLPKLKEFRDVSESLSAANPVIVRPLDEDSVAGYTSIRDIFDKPILILRVHTSRDIYAQGQTTIAYFILALVGIGLVVGVVMIWFLDWQMLSRLSRLNQGIGSIADSGDLSVRMPASGKDELSNLGYAINVMAETLEKSSDLMKRKNQLLESHNQELEIEIAARQQAERLYRTLAESSPAGVYIYQDGKFQFVNAKLSQQTGYSEAELLNMAPYELVHPEDRERARENAVQMLKGNLLTPYEFRAINQDKGITWAMETVTSVNYKGKRATLATSMDITERKRLEQELEGKNKDLDARNEELIRQREDLMEKTEEVERATRLKSEFLANMSHELRTPLNVIIGFSELMLDEVPGKITPEQRQSLTDILTSSRHLLTLINDVLDLSRIESGRTEFKPGSISVKDLIASVTRVMMPILTSRQQTIDLEIKGELPPVYADEGKLAQVLRNLLDNASKYSPDGSQVRIQAMTNGNWCQVSVIDRGIGIKKEDVGRLFQPFSRLDSSLAEERGGTGLGLTVVKQIVERHGGRVWVESEYGKGSRFTFTVPLARKKKSPGTAAYEI